MAEDGSMITLTLENRQGNKAQTHAHRLLAADLAPVPDCITLWEEGEVMGPQWVIHTDTHTHKH